MLVMWPILIFLGCGVFFVGTVVGSFLNVCIYRIPWEKSVIWPGSRCPWCYSPIAAMDNVPIWSWLALRGECRSCGAPISARYPLVELLVGVLFAGLFYADVVCGPRGSWGYDLGRPLATLAYHALLVALLVAATFIDYDLYVIPDEITITGMILGVLLGTLFPWTRVEPAYAATHVEGFKVGLIGLLVGAGLMELVRRIANYVATLIVSIINRKHTPIEAMGMGDVTLMGMIGAFLGWQVAVLTFFVGPFFGFAQACRKIIIKIKKLIMRQQLLSTDRELPFGPYLSMGATALLLSWRWAWTVFFRDVFKTLWWLFWHLLGVEVDPF